MFRYQYEANNGCSKGCGSIPPLSIDPITITVKAESETQALSRARKACERQHYILENVTQL